MTWLKILKDRQVIQKICEQKTEPERNFHYLCRWCKFLI